MAHARPDRRTRLTLSAIVVLVAGLSDPIRAMAQQAVWTRIGDVAGPAPLETHSAVYDSLGDRLLSYSGYRFVDGASVATSDMWEFRLSQPDSGWRQLATVGPAPTGLMQSSMTLDRANQRVLLFGGWPISGGVTTNDLHQLSLNGVPTWSVVPATKDTLRSRLEAFLCVDESSRSLVLYGGSAYFGDHYGAVNDLWTLPLDGAPVWSRVPVSNPPPPWRNSPQFAFDPQRRRVLVHGGISISYTQVYTDTWALSLGDTARWDEIATTGPQVPRAYGGALVDPVHDRLILAPGSTRTYPAPASERDTHELPLAAGGEWSKAPAPGAYHGTSYTYAPVYDSRRERLITMGNTFVQAFALAETTGWERLWPPDPVLSPGVMTGHVLVPDAARQVLWSVGGSEQTGSGDLWKLGVTGDAQWTPYPQPHRLPQSGHAAAFDSEADRILVVALGNFTTEVVELGVAGIPTEAVWAPRDTSPSQRVDHTAVVDPIGRRVIVFGGQYFAAHFTGVSRGDLWEVPLDSLSAWKPLAAAGPAPGARGSHFAFYDDLHHRMVMFGGWQQTGGPIRNYSHDAWALELSGAPAWTALDGTSWDPPVDGRLTYDPVNHRLFLFHAASLGTPSTTVAYMRGVEDDDAWVELTALGGPPEIDAPIAFAPWVDRLVVASTNSDGTSNDETWALQIDHAVPALASLESVTASPGCVTIAWRLGGAPAASVTLSRRASEGAWSELGRLLPDGEGRVTYDDRDVAAGARLQYRLSDGARVLLETAVNVPLRTPLSFAGARPAPVRGAARLTFALPVASEVRLELYDVRGARVLARDMGRQDAGEHLYAWRETGSLRPGLYVARLVTEGGTREAKVVLLP